VITAVLVFEGYQSPWSPDFIGANSAGIPYVPAQATKGLNAQQAYGAKLLHVEGCMACHMVDNVGGLRGPNLSKIADRATYNQLVTRLMAGGGGMPAYGGTLTPKKAAAIISFLETLGSTRETTSQALGSSP